MDEEGSLAARELQQRPGIGSPGRPAEHEVNGFSFALKQGNRNFARGERFANVSDQEIDHRGPAQGARHFLAERGQAPHQIETNIGAVHVRRKLR